MPLWLPDGPTLESFEATVRPFLAALSPLKAQADALAKVRDALLPRLISGKLKVDHLDIRLPPSMRAEAETAEATA